MATIFHNGSTVEKGSLLARALSGTWRPSPPPFCLSAIELENNGSLFLGSMTAALAWRQLRSSELKENTATQEFRQLYHVYLLRASIREHQIGQAGECLHAAGVDAVMAKGWLAAQLYPEKGLRHPGDIDLYVAPDQYQAASAAFFDGNCPDLPVDLHRGCPDLKDRTFDELCQRSQNKNIGGTKIQVMGPEDHLRLLCMHLLRHGVKHALGLCDIAALVESIPDTFDWEYCMSGDKRRSEWVSCVLCLAHQLLGADLGKVPEQARSNSVPPWMVPMVLRHWGTGFHTRGDTNIDLLHPFRTLQAIQHRWPDGIQATVHVGAPMNSLPRLPFQCLAFSARAKSYGTRMLGLQRPWSTPDLSSIKTGQEANQSLTT